jgi:deazaflavin-dependent oxidoreductase (nitroreductase family)
MAPSIATPDDPTLTEDASAPAAERPAAGEPLDERSLVDPSLPAGPPSDPSSPAQPLTEQAPPAGPPSDPSSPARPPSERPRTPTAPSTLGLAPREQGPASRAHTSVWPELAPPPPPSEGAERTHRTFMQLNHWAMVPALRAGLGPWIGTPIGGYLMLLRVRGRKSGVVRETPLSYLIAEGAAWVTAGFGPATQWYRNLLADPVVEIVLPGRTVPCIAEDVRDPAVRRRMLPALVRAVGLPGAFGGVDPRRATDDDILEAYAWVPLIRLRPIEGSLAAGPDDPGGTAWIWRQAVVVGLTVLLARAGVRLIRSTSRTAWRLLRR